MIDGALGSMSRISEVMVKMVRSDHGSRNLHRIPRETLNIGLKVRCSSGDLSAVVGLYIPLPPWLHMIVAPLFGMAGGALWAMIAGWLRTRFNANEVITTMMLNYVALYLLAYMVYGPMQEPGGYNYPQSASMNESLQLTPFSSGARVNTSVVVAIGILLFVVMFWRSRFGFAVDLLGHGIKITNYAGLNANKSIILTMMLSGAVCGIVGWIEVYGVHFRLLEGIGAGFGDLAVVITLLGKMTPIGILFAAFFVSILLVGGATMQRMTAIPYSIVDIIQGLVIVLLITQPMIQQKLQARKARDIHVE